MEWSKEMLDMKPLWCVLCENKIAELNQFECLDY